MSEKYGERFSIIDAHHVSTKAKLDSILAKNSEIDLNTDTLEAKVEVGNGHHASIDGKIVACDTGACVVASSALPAGAASEASLAALSAKITAANTGACVVASSALPAGAASEASLGALSAKVVVANTSACVIASSALPAGAASESSLASLNTKVVAVDTGAVTVNSCALPSGAADSAKQDDIKVLIGATNSALAGTLSVSAPAASKSVSTPISSEPILGMASHTSAEIDLGSTRHFSLVGSSTDTANSHQVDVMVSDVSGGTFYKTSHSGYFVDGDFHMLVSHHPYQYIKVKITQGDYDPAMSADFTVKLLKSD